MSLHVNRKLDEMLEDSHISRVGKVAARFEVSTRELDWHIEAVHGWEPHDDGYEEALEVAAECLVAGTCCFEKMFPDNPHFSVNVPDWFNIRD